MHKCIYCKKEFTKISEHVFPKGLGGQNVYVDFVCQDCNNKFSRFESELYQKSPIALPKTVDGIRGYKKKSIYPSILQSSYAFLHDTENDILYDGAQYSQMQFYVYSQIIEVENNLYIIGNTDESMALFQKHILSWIENHLILVSSENITNSTTRKIIKFNVINFELSHLELEKSIRVDDFVRIDILPKDKYNNLLKPRIFLDDRDLKSPKLRIRAYSMDEALNFTKTLLHKIKEKYSFNTYREINQQKLVIRVGMSFNYKLANRAIVKIGINCLIHYFRDKAELKYIERHLSFVYKGDELIDVTHESHSQIIDNPIESHTVFFYQREDELHIRLGLFNGQFNFGFAIPGLKVIDVNTYNRLVIKYHNRVNEFQNYLDFFRSFDIQA